MRILNLFAGIGGNRKFWSDNDIVAVERNATIAQAYQKNFPNDTVIVDDVYTYIQNTDLDSYDFLWASPPCQTHTMLQMTKGINIPDLTGLYGLMLYFQYTVKKAKWVIENVRPWYTPLVAPAFIIDRHYFWSNFTIKSKNFSEKGEYDVKRRSISQLNNELQLDISELNDMDDLARRQVLRNCVDPRIAQYILEQAFRDNKLLEYINR